MSDSDKTPAGEVPTSDFGAPPPTTDAGAPSVPAPAASAGPEDTLPTEPSSAEATVAEGIAADGDFREHYSLLFASVSLFVAAMWLPIEGRHLDLYAKDSIAGGFLAIFAAYGIFAAWMNIHSRRMIVWPMFFAAMDGLYVAGMRAFLLVRETQAPGAAAPKDAREWVNLFGSGCYVIALMSLWVLWTLLSAVLAGAKKAEARREAAKAARGPKR